MFKSDAIKHFGTATELARRLGVGKALVSKWPDVVPPRYAYEIERLTGGKLKADWPPKDRPGMVVHAPRASSSNRARTVARA